MTNKNFGLFFGLLFVIVFLIGHAQAAEVRKPLAQRMGLQGGHTYYIKPHHHILVDSFCFDHSRKAPGPEDNFTQVLTAERRATVTEHKKSIPLSDAIRPPNATLKISGLHFTQKEYVKRFGHRSFFGNDEDAGVNDWTRIRLENETSKRIKIRIQQNIVLGEDGDKNFNLKADALNFQGNQKKVQEFVWRSMAKKHQMLLQYLGFYHDKINGDYDSETYAQAIADFQKNEGLWPTGELDAATEDALTDAANVKTVALVNNANQSQFLFAVVEDNNTNERYRISCGDSFSAVNSSDDIAKFLVDEAKRRKVSPTNAFVQPRNMSQRDAFALAVSIKHRGAIVGHDLSISVLERSDDPSAIPPELSANIDYVLDDGKSFKSIQFDAERAYQKILDIRLRDRSQLKLEMESKNKTLLGKFVWHVKRISGSPRKLVTKDISVAQLLSLAESAMRESKGYSSKDVHTRVLYQLRHDYADEKASVFSVLACETEAP